MVSQGINRLRESWPSGKAAPNKGTDNGSIDAKEESIFLEAIELPSGPERIEFVTRRCGANLTLRQRVVELIELHSRQNLILDQAATPPDHLPTEEINDISGTRIGNYRIVKKLGEGGMGIVYLAEQLEPIQRRVALKVIKIGMDTVNVIARFEAERQTLALMEHPCITKVFDAGATHGGRPYFVMELVAGETITKYCDAQRLRLDERLELFARVCGAVQHAHQKGVIHRDLKPSNILITTGDGGPDPKIIDFGIAKATTTKPSGDTALTAGTAFVGTPVYMSPEQADSGSRDIDTRSDIYSLGSVLYELCTGETPLGNSFDGKGIGTIRELIQTRQPERPSSRVAAQSDEMLQTVCSNRRTPTRVLARMLRSELDWITMKCLSKDRSERYESAAELTREIDRYLAGDPVSAAAPSALYVFTKIARKHRRLLTLTLGIVLLMLLSVVITGRYALQANRAARRSTQAELLAQERLEEANRAWQSAEIQRTRATSAETSFQSLQRQQANQLAITRAIALFNGAQDGGSPLRPISDWLRAELGELSRLISTRAGNSAATAEATDDLELLQRIVNEQRAAFGSNDELVAETLDLLGDRSLRLGLANEAAHHFRESLLIRTEVAPDSLDRVDTMIQLGQTLKQMGKTSEAQSYFESARRRLSKRNDARRLSIIESAISEL